MTATIEVAGLEAVLDDNGMWTSGSKVLKDFLNNVFGTDLYPPSPSAGINPFAEQARAAGRHFETEVIWPAIAPTDDVEKVY